MKYTLLICISFAILSCKGKTETKGTAASDTTYIDIKGNKYKFLGQIQDSLRTSEQTNLIEKLNEITVLYISVKNNHMVFNLSREEFLAKGIPERYYNILEENIRDNNTFFDSNGIKDVDKMIEERKKTYNESIKNRKP